MKNKKIILSLATSTFVFVVFMVVNCYNQPGSKPLPVIFETDMGNDVDDALALDMLYKYADRGMINILAVCSNKNNKYALPFLDIMNTWYGYPGIPLGNMAGGPDTDDAPPADFLQPICEFSRDGKPVFQQSLNDYTKVPEATRLYRKILAGQPDTSVVIISVGFSTNIAKLLDTGPDEYSSLTGKELVRKKVKLLSMMAGNVRDHELEFNIVRDPAAARKVFAGWPTEIVVSPSELGVSILYPVASIKNDFDGRPTIP
jgi:inosine-uridine nucleoside N-ribohydrolase